MPAQAELHSSDAPGAAESPVSRFHLWGLRILYFLIAAFLLSTIGPRLAEPPPTLMTGVARALFVALGLLMALGIRYPLQMLPIMLFELAWKALWLAFIGLPLWAEGRLDGDNMDTFFSVAIGAPLVLIVLPWRYLLDNYIRRRSDRW